MVWYGMVRHKFCRIYSSAHFYFWRAFPFFLTYTSNIQYLSKDSPIICSELEGAWSLLLSFSDHLCSPWNALHPAFLSTGTDKSHCNSPNSVPLWLPHHLPFSPLQIRCAEEKRESGTCVIISLFPSPYLGDLLGPFYWALILFSHGKKGTKNSQKDNNSRQLPFCWF